MISRRSTGVLRGIGMLIVLASHLSEWMNYAGISVVHLRTQALLVTWGPLGVDLFLLASGYGLYKSVEKSRAKNGRAITLSFAFRRIKNVYLPYLIIAFLINVYSGEWGNAYAEGRLWGAVFDWLTAASFWFIRVILVLYILFMIAFSLNRKRLRFPLIMLFVVLYTAFLFHSGHIDFWTLSNAAFLIGIYYGALEDVLMPAKKKWRTLRLIALAVSLAGLLFTWQMMLKNGGSGAEDAYGWELTVNVFFSLVSFLAVSLACEIRNRIFRLLAGIPCAVLKAIGDASLYIYLLHQVIFWALLAHLYRAEPAPGNYMAAASLIGIIAITAGVLIQTAGDRAALLLKKHKGSGKKTENDVS